MTILTLSVIALATLVTSFISGILGMAGGMMLMGVLIFLLPVPAAMLLHGITQLAANGWRAGMLRGSIDWRVARGYALGALVAGVSGPILDIFFVRSKMGRHAVVATKALSQSFTHLLKVAYFGGLLTMGRADIAPQVALAMIALAFLGTTFSRQVLERIDDSAFREWTRWTMMGVGSVYLVSGTSLLVQ